MDDGGKTENEAVKKLIQELEYYLHLTSQNVKALDKNVSNAREVLSVSTFMPTCRTEAKEPLNESCKSSDTFTELPSNDEDSLLENEISRILKVAEKVRDKSMTQQGCKLKLNQMPSGGSKSVKNFKNERICPTGIKDPAMSHRSTSTSSKTPRKPVISSTFKSTYQKDFSLAKAKSLPSLCRLSKSTESPCNERSEKKSHDPQDKNVALTTFVGSSKLSVSSQKKDFVKINAQNIGLPRKKNSRIVIGSKRTSEFLSMPLLSRNFEESRLSEEVAVKSQSPNCKEVLAAVRDSYSFINDSKKKKSKRELKLKESFMNKCLISVKQCETKPELQTVLKALLPHCGWAYGQSRSFSSRSNLNDVKDAVAKSKDKLEAILKDAESDLSSASSISSKVVQPKNNSFIQENFTSKECITPHTSIISTILHGIEVPPCLYYGDVCELVSFLSAVCELHEYHIQQRILRFIHPVISEYLNSKTVEDTDSENNNERWKESLALLLKTAAAIADFTGHLTMPILAGINSTTDSVST